MVYDVKADCPFCKKTVQVFPTFFRYRCTQHQGCQVRETRHSCPTCLRYFGDPIYQHSSQDH